MRVGILGFGQAGYAIARGLHEMDSANDLSVHAWKRRPWTKDATQRAAEARVTLVPSAVALGPVSDIYLSLVHAAASLTAARMLGPAAVGKSYVDLTIRSPKRTTETAALVESSGGHFVDGAIMGPLARQGARVSIVLSGPLAEDAASRLNAMGMNTRAIGERVGLASEVKMIRSVYSKGLEAAVLELALACHVTRSLTETTESLEELMSAEPFTLPFGQMVRALLLEQEEHASRRAAEMELVAATLRDLGVRPLIAEAAQRRLATCAEALRDVAHPLPRGDTEATVLQLLASGESAEA